MGWLEFAVIIGCGLFGFFVVYTLIDHRRTFTERRRPSADRRRAAEVAEQPLWWETLKVDKNATPEQVRAAFRREISKYHPDRVEGLGIELQELADRKAKEVNRAYTLAKQERGLH
jgi:DnaJ-class molecular chaperone